MPMQKFKKPSDIGYAIDCLKHSMKVKRKVWPEGVFIYLVKPSIIPAQNLRNEAKRSLFEVSSPEDTIKIGSHIDMRTQDGSIVIGWQFNTNDALADDWELVM